MYGRRRVGKTELLREFSRKTGAIYLLARRESKKDQLEKLSRELSAATGDKAIGASPFQNYDGFFEYISRIDKPVIFDEFPHLVESSPELPSILQDHWDNTLSKKNTYLGVVRFVHFDDGVASGVRIPDIRAQDGADAS